MTLDQAIKIIDPDTTRDALAEIDYYGGFSGKEMQIRAVEEACKVLCDYVREKRNITCPRCGEKISGGEDDATED